MLNRVFEFVSAAGHHFGQKKRSTQIFFYLSPPGCSTCGPSCHMWGLKYHYVGLLRGIISSRSIYCEVKFFILQKLLKKHVFSK